MNIQIKRGLEVGRVNVTPAAGEMLWTTDNKELWVGDGATAGGIKVTQAAETSADTKFIPLTEKAVANGVATLDANGQIPTSQLHSLAISDTYTVSTEADLILLDAGDAAANGGIYRGDVAIVTGTSKTFIANADTGTTAGQWTEMLAPAAPVQSVNSKTGVVLLGGADIEITGYIKPPLGGFDLAPSDTVNEALGKLEKNLENAVAGGGDVNVQSNWTETNTASDAFILNKPAIVNDLTTGGITDVLSAEQGKTLKTLVDTKEDALGNPAIDGQVLASTAAGVRSWTTITATLDGLTDTNLGTLADLDYLRYDSATSKWVNTAPETINLDDIANVTASAPATNDVLSFDGTNWVNQTLNPVTSITDLTDVNTTSTTPAVNDLLSFDGTNWVPVANIDLGTF